MKRGTSPNRNNRYNTIIRYRSLRKGTVSYHHWFVQWKGSFQAKPTELKRYAVNSYE